MIDYKELLRKYINHVGTEEGWTFMPYSGDGFSEEEVQELNDLDVKAEINPETPAIACRSTDYENKIKAILLEDLKSIGVDV